MRSRMHLALLLLFLASATAFPGEPAFESRAGVFRVSFESSLQPLQINRIHSWTLHITDTAGDPVEDAAITVDGGMPIHDHGLPTQPRITREIAPGHYLLEGLRFHMPGSWELVITIEAGDAQDVVVIDLDI